MSQQDANAVGTDAWFQAEFERIVQPALDFGRRRSYDHWAEPDDAVQDALTSVWQKRHSLDTSRPLLPYVKQAILNSLAYGYRKQSVHQRAVNQIDRRLRGELEKLQFHPAQAYIEKDHWLAHVDSLHGWMPKRLVRFLETVVRQGGDVQEAAKALKLGERTTQVYTAQLAKWLNSQDARSHALGHTLGIAAALMFRDIEMFSFVGHDSRSAVIKSGTLEPDKDASFEAALAVLHKATGSVPLSFASGLGAGLDPFVDDVIEDTRECDERQLLQLFAKAIENQPSSAFYRNDLYFAWKDGDEFEAWYFGMKAGIEELRKSSATFEYLNGEMLDECLNDLERIARKTVNWKPMLGMKTPENGSDKVHVYLGRYKDE